MRLRLGAGCRMALEDPAHFLAGLETADVVAEAAVRVGHADGRREHGLEAAVSEAAVSEALVPPILVGVVFAGDADAALPATAPPERGSNAGA